MASSRSAALTVVRSEDAFEEPTLGRELGSSFSWSDRLFFGWRDGKVFDYSDWEARDLGEMLSKDYQAKKIENVLSLPIISAARSMSPAKGDRGEFEWLQAFWDADPLNGGCETPLDLIVDQMTTAISFKKAFWEIVWDKGVGDFSDKTVYRKLGWRPQTTCRLMRDPRTAKVLGFEQEQYYTGPEIAGGAFPIEIEARNAFIYLHGARRDPINGTSDLEVPYWAWKTKQKILFLWFQFLEGVSLPRTLVGSQDIAVSQAVARGLAKVKSSGVLPYAFAGDPNGVKIDSLDLSGKGAEQFMAAIRWLDGAATGAVLASFLDLTGNATNGNGPVGVHLARDAGDFFLQSLEAKTREMQHAIRRDLFGPLVRLNFGPAAKIPLYDFEPLNAEDKSASVTMLTGLLESRDPSLVPDEFIGQLASQVADYLGMNGEKIRKAFDKTAAEARKRAEAMAKAGTAPGGASPAGQAAASALGAANAATKLVAKAKTA